MPIQFHCFDILSCVNFRLSQFLWILNFMNQKHTVPVMIKPISNFGKNYFFSFLFNILSLVSQILYRQNFVSLQRNPTCKGNLVTYMTCTLAMRAMNVFFMLINTSLFEIQVTSLFYHLSDWYIYCYFFNATFLKINMTSFTNLLCT